MLDSVRDCKLLYSGPIQGESAIILLRSKLAAIATRLGFSEARRENISLVASELVSNQVKYAGGRGLMQIWQQPGPVLDIFALDYGPGIANLALAQEDGYSSGNTLGKGLGSIQRLSDQTHIYSRPETLANPRKWCGTAVLARFFQMGKNSASHETAARSAPRRLDIGLFSRPLSDEQYNGDRIYLQRQGDKLRWLHLDGLGHGEGAQQATSNLSGLLFHGEVLNDTLSAVDRQLKDTRGAVAIVSETCLRSQEINILGVGDMHAHVIACDEMHNLAFAPGVLGREHRLPLPFHRHCGGACMVITATDGIRRNWDIANFPGLFNMHPQLIAYVLGNIMGRISDDQSICVAGIA